MGLKLSTALPRFSDNLVPDPDFEGRGTKACDDIFEILRHKRRDVAQVKISGSMGKRTAVSYPGMQQPDFDIVIFLNIPNPQKEFSKQSGPPFRQILREFETTFKLYPNKITILNTAATNFIRIQVDGFKIDVAPAIFFNCNNWLFGPSQAENQKSQTLELIKGLSSPQNYGHYYSAGLAQAAVDYVKREAARLNAHPLIRLAKFWHRNLDISSHSNYSLGQSYLMERMAIHACKELGSNNYDLVARLEKFLQLMSNFRHTRILEPWTRERATEIWRERSSFGNGPLVLDPLNPYNNIARLHHDSSVRWNIINIYEDGADLCLEKLSKLKQKEADGENLQSEDEVKKMLDQSGSRCDDINNYYPFQSPLVSESQQQQQQQQEQQQGIGWGGIAAIGIAAGALMLLNSASNPNNRRN